MEDRGLRPQYSVIGLARIPPEDSHVPVSTPGLLQAWNIDTKPRAKKSNMGIRFGAGIVPASFKAFYNTCSNHP